MKRLILFFLLFFPSIIFPQDENSDYYKIVINTGEKPECFYCRANFSKLDNYLKIDARNASDVVVKMINSQTQECVRLVFISAGDVYFLTNIPEGIYYLKIAYGYDWSKKVVGGGCTAKFARNAHYQIGNDLLDYFLQKSYNGYQVPSYELVLKVYSENRSNEFDASDISEEEFYR